MMNDLVIPTTRQSDPSPRRHGDSYSEALERNEGLDGTTSTHGPPLDRRPEEPSDAAAEASGSPDIE